MNKIRRAEIKKNVSYLKTILSLMEESLTISAIADAEQDAFDNLPDGIQESDRGVEMEDNIEALNDCDESIGDIKETINDVIEVLEKML